MNNKFKLFGIILFSIFVSFSLIGGCGSSSGSGDGSFSRDGAFAVGRVDFDAPVVNKDLDRDIVKLVKNLFTFTWIANAQGGIMVNVFQGGVMVETTTTDSEGNFTINTTGDVTLQFVTSDGTFETDISLPVDNVTTFTVTLDAINGTATVDDIRPGIDCDDGGSVVINQDVSIDGQGEDCIETEGDCSVNITGGSVVLLNCDSCIEANDSSTVVITSGDFTCDSSDDGIETEDDATVDISSDTLTITSDEDDIDSEDDSSIVVGSDDCLIEGDVVEFDDSTIDLEDDCESTEVLDGEIVGSDDDGDDIW